MLQGWERPPLEYDSEELARRAVRVKSAPGWYSFDPPTVPLRLPGDAEPEVDAWDLDEFRGLDGVPIAGCGCRGGVGRAALHVQVAYLGHGDEVTWTVDDLNSLPRERYDGAIRQLLERVREAPRLIGECA
jgi:hypothetical protein